MGSRIENQQAILKLYIGICCLELPSNLFYFILFICFTSKATIHNMQVDVSISHKIDAIGFENQSTKEVAYTISSWKT